MAKKVIIRPRRADVIGHRLIHVGRAAAMGLSTACDENMIAFVKQGQRRGQRLGAQFQHVGRVARDQLRRGVVVVVGQFAVEHDD